MPFSRNCAGREIRVRIEDRPLLPDASTLVQRCLQPRPGRLPVACHAAGQSSGAPLILERPTRRPLGGAADGAGPSQAAPAAPRGVARPRRHGPLLPVGAPSPGAEQPPVVELTGKELASAITATQRWEQVATLAAQQVLQPMHVAAALTHLAKLHAMGLPPREVERFRASGLVQRLADRAVVLLSNRVEFPARNIAACLRALAKLEPASAFRPSQAAMNAFGAATVRAEGTFSAPFVANTLWGFAALGHNPGDEAMRVLLSAALASISRFTPHNISSSVWALSRLTAGASGPFPAPAAGSFPEATGAVAFGSSRVYSAVQSSASDGADAASDRADAASDTDSGDEGLGSGVSSGDEVLRPVAPVSAARQSTAAGIAQLLEGLAGATEQRASEFKPAHIGDALWGFGSLGIHPGDAALGGLLDAAASAGAPGFKGSNAACALIGLGRLVSAHPRALHAQHAMLLSPEAGGGLMAGLTAEGGAPVDAGGSEDGNDAAAAAAATAAVTAPVQRAMSEHPGLKLLAEVSGAAAPSLAPDRLVEIVSTAQSLGVSSSLAHALCAAAAAGEVQHYSRAALPLVLHAACAFEGEGDAACAAGYQAILRQARLQADQLLPHETASLLEALAAAAAKAEQGSPGLRPSSDNVDAFVAVMDRSWIKFTPFERKRCTEALALIRGGQRPGRAAQRLAVVELARPLLRR